MGEGPLKRDNCAPCGARDFSSYFFIPSHLRRVPFVDHFYITRGDPPGGTRLMVTSQQDAANSNLFVFRQLVMIKCGTWSVHKGYTAPLIIVILVAEMCLLAC